MKQLILLVGILSLLSCDQTNNLTPEEEELITQIGFDTDLISELKGKTDSTIKQLPAIEGETGEALEEGYNGIYTETSEEVSYNLVKLLKDRYRRHGYLIFMMEPEYGKYSIAVIKGRDDLEILRYRQTDGINHGHENKDVVAKISQWKSKYGLDVIGCGRDWLHVEFDALPPNIPAFAEEVYAFCPDAVDQGVGDMKSLQQVIVEMKGIWLWWD